MKGMDNLTKQEINNFKEAIADLNISIPEEEKELRESKKCLEYMNLNFYDENIEKKIIAILEFYINDLKNNLDFSKGQQETYEDIIEKNKSKHKEGKDETK